MSHPAEKEMLACIKSARGRHSASGDSASCSAYNHQQCNPAFTAAAKPAHMPRSVHEQVSMPTTGLLRPCWPVKPCFPTTATKQPHPVSVMNKCTDVHRPKSTGSRTYRYVHAIWSYNVSSHEHPNTHAATLHGPARQAATALRDRVDETSTSPIQGPIETAVRTRLLFVVFRLRALGLDHVGHSVVEGGEVAVVVGHGAAQDGHVLRGHHVEHRVVADGGVLSLACRAAGVMGSERGLSQKCEPRSWL